jgi:ribosomal protein L37AE/L43A
MSTETVFECPKCQREGMVRLHGDSDIFECIYCRYKADLSEQSAKPEVNWFMLWLFGLAIAFSLLLA